MPIGRLATSPFSEMTSNCESPYSNLGLFYYAISNQYTLVTVFLSKGPASLLVLVLLMLLMVWLLLLFLLFVWVLFLVQVRVI